MKIEKASKTLSMLNNYNSLFKVESEVITSAKCFLLKNKSLDDFVSPYVLEIEKEDDKYYFYLDEWLYELTVFEDMIVDYDIKAL